MKNSLSLLFILLIAASLSAQKKKKIPVYELDQIKGLFFQPNTIEPYSGLAFEEYPNGQKKAEIPITNGKVDGTAKEWAQNGKKTYESEYVMGIQQGSETQWHANGRKKLLINYKDGIPDGVCTEWWKGGGKKSQGNFVNGKEEGKHTWWYSTGNLDQEIIYINGKAEGLVKNWYESGPLRLKNEYKNGMQDGKAEEWFVNGQHKMTGQYTNDEEDGEFLFYSKKGILEGRQIFENGKLLKDYNYRSGSIRIPNGYIEVHNGKESFYAIKIHGNQVYQRKAEEITYVVDGQLLQLLQTPLKTLEGIESATSEEAILQKFVEKESAYIKKMTNFEIDVMSSPFQNKAGKNFLLWHFESPLKESDEKTNIKINREYYLTMVCNQQIVNLYSVQTNKNKPADIELLLKRIAEEVKVEKERIDLNVAKQQLFSGK